MHCLATNWERICYGKGPRTPLSLNTSLKVFITKCHLTHDFFIWCARPIGNLALKGLWIHFTQAEVFSLEREKREEAIHSEELRGAQHTMIWWKVQCWCTLDLNVSIGESSQEDSQCAIFDPVISAKQEKKAEVDVACTPQSSNKGVLNARVQKQWVFMKQIRIHFQNLEKWFLPKKNQRKRNLLRIIPLKLFQAIIILQASIC